MHAAALHLELRIPDCRSLKEKRRRLRPVLEHVRKRLDLSAAEVGHQDSWQRSAVGIALVAPQAARLDELVESVRRWALSLHDVELIEFAVGHVEMP